MQDTNKNYTVYIFILPFLQGSLTGLHLFSVKGGGGDSYLEVGQNSLNVYMYLVTCLTVFAYTKQKIPK